MGQGTAYIKSSNFVVNPEIIRQYDNHPGYHVTYFTDMSRRKNYIGATNIYSSFSYVQISQGYTIKDMEVFGDVLYFCGHTSMNNGLIGWYNLIDLLLGNLTSAYFDTTILNAIGGGSLDNIEVFQNATNDICIAGYGKDLSSRSIVYEGLMTGATTMDFRVSNPLGYNILDMTLTDSYVVYAGDITSFLTVIHPFPKSTFLATNNAPYHIFNVGGTALEPYKDLRIVDIGNDTVATLSYREEVGFPYSMVLREYDLSNAFPSFYVSPQPICQIQLPYAVQCIYDFRYNKNIKHYVALHNYEVFPADFRDAVTKIDISTGTVPSSVPSDYLSLTNHTMRSMSLSDSSMYVAYGYDNISNESVFWKDYQYATATGACLITNKLLTNPLTSCPHTAVNDFFGIPWNSQTLNAGEVYMIQQVLQSTLCH